MSADDLTPARLREEQELGLTLCAPCGQCGHEVEDHAPEGCLVDGCRCEADMTGVEVTSVLASSWLAQHDARIRRQSLREAAEMLRLDLDEPWGMRAANRVEDFADRIEEP